MPLWYNAMRTSSGTLSIYTPEGRGSLLAQSFINYMSSDAVRKLVTRFDFLHVTDISQRIRNQHLLENQ